MYDTVRVMHDTVRAMHDTVKKTVACVFALACFALARVVKPVLQGTWPQLAGS